MKIKNIILCIGAFAYFLAGINTAMAEDAGVPNTPEEIRVLPGSFKENYKGEAYNYVESTSFFGKIKVWLIDKIGSWFSVNEERAAYFFGNIQYVFYALIILAVVYIIIKIILNKEGSWIFKRKKEEINEFGYEIGENIREVNFDNLIREAVVNKDYRSAIRYYYLLLLKKLDENSIIEYDSQKTAYDYQVELDGTKHAIGFNKATYYYTYIWYGAFIIDEEEYDKTSIVYLQLLKQLGYE